MKKQAVIGVVYFLFRITLSIVVGISAMVGLLWWKSDNINARAKADIEDSIYAFIFCAMIGGNCSILSLGIIIS
jgi:hypothetical protein